MCVCMCVYNLSRIWKITKIFGLLKILRKLCAVDKKRVLNYNFNRIEKFTIFAYKQRISDFFLYKYFSFIWNYLSNLNLMIDQRSDNIFVIEIALNNNWNFIIIPAQKIYMHMSCWFYWTDKHVGVAQNQCIANYCAGGAAQQTAPLWSATALQQSQ